MDDNVGVTGGGGVVVELLPPPPQAANRPVSPRKNRAAKDRLPGRYLRARPLAEIDVMSAFPLRWLFVMTLLRECDPLLACFTV
jgi:hypothetical protein